MSRERNYALDALRVFACIMIVLMHSPMPVADGTSVLQGAVSWFTAPSIGVFFMLSGALLLPVKGTTMDFLCHRLSKVLWPTVIWTLVYMGLGMALFDAPFSLKALLSIPFSVQGSNILWFMYVLVGLYLIAPVISPWLEKCTCRESTLYLALFALTFCLPYIQQWLFIGYSTDSWLYYFSGYLGYFYCGWYLIRFDDKIRLRYLLAGYMFSAFMALYFKLASVPIDFYQYFWYLSVLTFVSAAFWFKTFLSQGSLFDRMAKRGKKFLSIASSLSFGVYLIHFAIVRYVLWHVPLFVAIPSYLLQTVVIAVMGFALSLALSYLIAMTRLGKYIIGYSVPI